MLDSIGGKRIMHPRHEEKAEEAALLFNNLSNLICVGIEDAGFLAS